MLTKVQEIEKTTPAALEIVDLERFPLHRPASATLASRVEEAREQLTADGCCRLASLIRPEALARVAAETQALAPYAHFTRSRATVYGGEPDFSFPADHPRRVEVQRDNGFVAGDMISPGSLMRALYHAPEFQAFLARCIGVDVIYEFADPLASLVVNVLHSGAGHGWHFDTNEFVVTLLTQPPEAGGRFEYCPGIRTPKEEHYGMVGRVLAGERDPVRILDLCPGDLQIFFGRYSMHRVTPVEGVHERHTVIFAYARRPGMIGNPAKTRQIFGRLSDSHSGDAAAYARDDGLTD